MMEEKVKEALKRLKSVDGYELSSVSPEKKRLVEFLKQEGFDEEGNEI